MNPFGRKPPVLVRIEGNFQWQAAFDHESGTYIGTCAPLRLNAIADSWQELLEAIREATDLLFSDLLRTGELEDFMRRNGWTASRPLPATGTPVRFDVPFDLARASSPRELVAH